MEVITKMPSDDIEEGERDDLQRKVGRSKDFIIKMGGKGNIEVGRRKNRHDGGGKSHEEQEGWGYNKNNRRNIPPIELDGVGDEVSDEVDVYKTEDDDGLPPCGEWEEIMREVNEDSPRGDPPLELTPKEADDEMRKTKTQKHFGTRR